MSSLPKVFLTPEDAHKMIQTAFTSEFFHDGETQAIHADGQCGTEHMSRTRTSSELAPELAESFR
jgi:hypothetical protein